MLLKPCKEEFDTSRHFSYGANSSELLSRDSIEREPILRVSTGNTKGDRKRENSTDFHAQ